MNLAACSSLATSVESGTWYRAIQPQHWTTALQTAQTQVFPTRFNAGAIASPQFQVLYLAENQLVALFEVQALLGSPYPGRGGYFPQPRQAWAIINVDMNLQEVANLTYIAAQQSIRTTSQELTGDWYGYQQRSATTASVGQPTGIAPTQELGAALYNVPDLEGFRTLSAKVPDQMILVVFPRKLQSGSWVRFENSATGQEQLIEG